MAKRSTKPRRVHVTSQMYIRNWAVNGQVVVESPRGASKPERRNVASVGYRTGWWGSNRQMSTATEQAFQICENRVAPVCRDLNALWPLGRDDRAELAKLMAIHVVRSPGWHQALRAVSVLAIGDELQRRRWGDDVEHQAVVHFLGDEMRIEAMLKDVSRVASALMSMHWSLISFDGPLLASCDQPVVCVPRLRDGEQMPIEAMPRTGFLETAEIRFPVSPRLALLLTWLPAPDQAAVVKAEYRFAADINRSTHAQADKDWFYRPGSPRPPRISAPVISGVCEPVSYELVPGYSYNVASASRRRAEADQLMRQLIGSGETDVMRFVVVSDRSNSAAA